MTKDEIVQYIRTLLDEQILRSQEEHFQLGNVSSYTRGLLASYRGLLDHISESEDSTNEAK